MGKDMAIASDVEIAQAAELKPISEVAGELGLGPDEIEPYGRFKAKVGLPPAAYREKVALSVKHGYEVRETNYADWP